jgi:hypothetical protein
MPNKYCFAYIGMVHVGDSDRQPLSCISAAF